MLFFFFKQKTAYEMRISDWSSDVCSSDLDATSSAPQAASGMTVPMRSALRRIDIFEFPLLEPVTRLEALNRGSVLLLGELGSFHDGYITELGMTGMIHNYYFRHTSVIIDEVKCKERKKVV